MTDVSPRLHRPEKVTATKCEMWAIWSKWSDWYCVLGWSPGRTVDSKPTHSSRRVSQRLRHPRILPKAPTLANFGGCHLLRPLGRIKSPVPQQHQKGKTSGPTGEPALRRRTEQCCSLKRLAMTSVLR